MRPGPMTLVFLTWGDKADLSQSLISLDENIGLRVFDHTIAVDASGDPAITSWLGHAYRFDQLLTVPNGSARGLAIRAAWEHLPSDCWVLQYSEGEMFCHPPNLLGMKTVLGERPYLLQMALRMQGWEGALADPGTYEQCNEDGWQWLEHRAGWWDTVSIYRSSLAAQTLAVAADAQVMAPQVEGHPIAAYGIWGSLDTAPGARLLH